MRTSRKGNRNTFLVYLCLFGLVSLSGCSFLDFGGDDSKNFELKFFWDNAPDIGEEDPDNPGFDRDGNKRPSPEILATYYFPDVHAGYAWVDGEQNRILPTINVEIAEIKVPYARWFVFAVGAGVDEAHMYLGKRLTSILEVTMGPMLVRRFDTAEWVVGFQVTLLKF